ncbi:hypothetical protein ILYODFUR_030046 [Ilyodon furcidens]|uniref:Uncharacterized protein n=1 Tax=Ilyodon furcidens TaxID=33524 RepID=A0ABV0TMY2_9TELE
MSVCQQRDISALSLLPASQRSLDERDRTIGKVGFYTASGIMGSPLLPPFSKCAGRAFFFAKPMRENKYMTMMDPFQKKYGNVLSTALIFPALVADVLWVARTLVSLDL